MNIRFQLQHSSISRPSLTIRCTYSLASLAESPLWVSIAYAMASFTAAGILFDDLCQTKVSNRHAMPKWIARMSIPWHKYPCFMASNQIPNPLRILPNEVLNIHARFPFGPITRKRCSVCQELLGGIGLPFGSVVLVLWGRSTPKVQGVSWTFQTREDFSAEDHSNETDHGIHWLSVVQ